MNFILTNDDHRADLTQQLVEQEGFKQEAENLLEIDTNFHEACAES